MERVHIYPSPLHGTITPPPSKSAAHRAIICAALAKGVSELSPCLNSDDIFATTGVMRSLGASIEKRGGLLTVDGWNTRKINEAELDCHESGSTLRFLIPVAATVQGRFTFTGAGRLPARPIGPYLECLPKAGITCETEGGLPLTISGKLQSGLFSLPGNVSSQFITGLLLALPLLDGDSRIQLTSPLESAGYIALTTDIMGKFGVTVTETDDGYLIKGNQGYVANNFTVEGDWSQAAFWLVAGALGFPVACEGLNAASKQGDMAIVSLLRRYGAIAAVSSDTAQTQLGNLHGIEIDASQIPDLVPILAVVACFSTGRTVIKNAARLRIKESDRLHTITVGLRAFGARIEETDDGLVIDGCKLHGGKANGADDHRIVMALSIAAANCCGESTIDGCECVAKSYPDFFGDFNLLGGHADVIHVG